ncbi:MAG: phage tail assembly protein, partial [Desulfobacterales bacterium]
MLQTEFEFSLPKGFIDPEGNLHRNGVMRLATAADEILPQKDPRVQSNPAYLIIILLSRVITNLGEIKTITPKTIEDLFSADLAYLQDFYQRINENGKSQIKAVCPKCEHPFELE